jgi:protein TonB
VEFISGQKPPYPPAATSARVQGVVVVEATVTPDGKVKQAKIISGHPLLLEAASKAVRGWNFKPATINGKPVEAPVRVEVTFRGNW